MSTATEHAAPTEHRPTRDLAWWRTHLMGAPLPPAAWRWGVALVMGALAALLRLPRLGEPHQLVFDETYYVKQAYTMWQVGYEKRWPEDADASFTVGNADVYLPDADFPVHPPIGKWMIALGEMLFGIDSSFGWRFGAAVAGIAMVVMISLVATAIFRNVTAGAIAGLLLAVDGHHIVHSRTSLLDIFLGFWALAAFCALIADRDDYRARLARARAGGLGPDTIIWLRPWRFVAALSLGMAIGTKWSGLYFLAAFGIFTVLWDFGARRAAGSAKPVLMGFWRDGVIAFFMLVPLSIVVYIASWAGWFASDDAHLRTWGAENPSSLPIPDALRSLWHYHEQMLEFHVGLSSPHTYQANPWSWVAQWRPTSFFYESPEPGNMECGADSCARAILSVGNVAVWWVGGVSLAVAAFMWLAGRDWRAGAILAGMIGGWAPWFIYQERTIYAFYAVAFEAFVVLAATYVATMVLGKPGDSPVRLQIGASVVVAYLLIAVAISWYFYPVNTGITIPQPEWADRMWFKSWI